MPLLHQGRSQGKVALPECPALKDHLDVQFGAIILTPAKVPQEAQ